MVELKSKQGTFMNQGEGTSRDWPTMWQLFFLEKSPSADPLKHKEIIPTNLSKNVYKNLLTNKQDDTLRDPIYSIQKHVSA